MSQNYQQYNSNPYGQADPEAGYRPTGVSASSNPYGDNSGYGSQNPYGESHPQPSNPHSALQHQDSQASQYSQNADNAQYGAQHHQSQVPPQHGAQPMSRDDYLQRIEGAKANIGRLTSDIQSIANIHQRMLSSPDNRSSAELEAIVTQTQIRNTAIKDDIKFLEKDASRGGSDSFKKSQVESLKRSFKAQLESFQKEEADYSKRYRDAIGRQYRIINPEASDAEVQEAANADWGDEGIFTQALKSNRSGQANSVLGAVRARHNDIQRIEKTMSELALLFQQLNEQVVYQEPMVARIEEQTEQVNTDAKHANQQLGKATDSARRARKLKWICLAIVVAIIAILAIVLGIYFGYVVPKNNKN